MTAPRDSADLPPSEFDVPPLRPDLVRPGEEIWVFAYGSLMWNPGFAFVERRPARLRGYHRRFCVYSHIYRGTPEAPGLVLGLDRGGSCRGIAFRVAAERAPQTLAYLWDREMVTSVYRPALRTVEAGGEPVRALCFLANPAHRQYCGERDIACIAALIRQGHGRSGSNREYLENTVAHLRELGIIDRGLEALLERVKAGL